MNINADEIVIRARERIDERIRAATIGTFSSVIRMTPVDSGRAKGNWQPTIGSPASGENWQNDPISAVESIVPQHSGSVVYLTNNVPYIQKLEYDAHSQQAPNGMVRISVARFEGLLNGTG